MPELQWITEYTDQNPGFTESDRENNVTIIFNTLFVKGYTRQSIAAICANMEYEGYLNPGQLEGLTPPDVWDMYENGGGLCGWTPVAFVDSTNLTYLYNWCESEGLEWRDGDSQVAYLNYEMTDWDGHERLGNNPAAVDYGYSADPPITALEFISSTLNPVTLCDYFLFYYEKPRYPSATIDGRRQAATKWYQFLEDLPDPTPVTTSRKMPLYMYLSNKRIYLRRFTNERAF